MKRKSQSLFLPLALLFVFHFLHSPPAYADTDGSEIYLRGFCLVVVTTKNDRCNKISSVVNN